MLITEKGNDYFNGLLGRLYKELPIIERVHWNILWDIREYIKTTDKKFLNANVLISPGRDSCIGRMSGRLMAKGEYLRLQTLWSLYIKELRFLISDGYVNDIISKRRKIQSNDLCFAFTPSQISEVYEVSAKSPVLDNADMQKKDTLDFEIIPTK